MITLKEITNSEISPKGFYRIRKFYKDNLDDYLNGDPEDQNQIVRTLSNMLRDFFSEIPTGLFTDATMFEKGLSEHPITLQIPHHFIFQNHKEYLSDTEESKLKLKGFLNYSRITVKTTSDENQLFRKSTTQDGSGKWYQDPIERYQLAMDEGKILLRDKKKIYTKNPIPYLNEDFKIFCQKRKV